ncbi:response regulator transcription factor [Rhodoblastus sp.]|uniref:response regulator transcription factor n=1 Tax=Rhodoblastus sp. TaxID=1962975 RepID=UPI003FD8ABC5
MKILVVEDAADIAEQLRRGLTRSGYVVDMARDGVSACFKAETETYAALILDIGLPKVDGLTVIRKLREANVSTPILVLSAQSAWTARVEGIDAGADDYMTKPFQIEEVIARLRAITRRGVEHNSVTLKISDLSIDTSQMLVAEAGRQIDLTPLEYRTLHFLARNKGRLVSQGELVEHVYAADSEPGSNAIEVLIGRIRRKMSRQYIKTRRGFGYVLSEPDQE